MRQDSESGAILVVGGGRWARVYLSVLAGLTLPFSKVIVVSRHGGASLAGAIAQANARQPEKFFQVQDLEAALAAHPVTAAIVVNAARDHAATALALLARRIPTLVEKPVALTVAESSRLIAAARAVGTLLRPGHVLSFCAYLENFAAAARALGPTQSVALHWRDAASETRYGETKSFDASLGVAEDFGPHLFSILASVLGDRAGRIGGAEIERGGLAVEIAGAWNGIAMTLSLARGAVRRERLIVLKTRDGQEARLDFSVEPGTMVIGGKSRSADPHWPHVQSPLALQLSAFLQDSGAPGTCLDAIAAATDFTAEMARHVRVAQESWLGSPAWSGARPEDQLVVLRELLAPLLLAARCWRAGDNAALEALAQKALQSMAGKSPRPATAELAQMLCAGG